MQCFYVPYVVDHMFGRRRYTFSSTQVFISLVTLFFCILPELLPRNRETAKPIILTCPSISISHLPICIRCSPFLARRPSASCQLFSDPSSMNLIPRPRSELCIGNSGIWNSKVFLVFMPHVPARQPRLRISEALNAAPIPTPHNQ